MSNLKAKVVVFDGICVLCSRGVAFILKHDAKQQFRFASMQSKTGRALLLEYGLDPDDPTSLLLVDEGKGYINSEAIIRIACQFGLAWHIVKLAYFIPRCMRDAIYRWFARNRYRWFGQHATCSVPSPDLSDRFLQ